MKPYDVNIVADYIILRLNADEKMSLINLKLQKLLYYLQAWALGINKERFMDTSFEAWVHGPVCRTLYDRFKNTKSLYSFISSDDVNDKTPETEIEREDIIFINYILDNYAGFSGAELEAMTHEEQPWIEARKGMDPMQGCNKEISEELMQEYYGKRWEEIND
ncbi:Panacea domain-containing protein [Bacteroides sp. AN502(2024)]